MDMESNIPLTAAAVIEGTSEAGEPEIEATSAAEEPIVQTPSRQGIQWPLNSIFHAPGHIRYSKGFDFEPKLVSIGPYYHGRINLKSMEDLKLTCMSDLQKMRPVGGSNIDAVPVQEFTMAGEHARLFYKGKIDYNGDEFVRMLILDSFFIIRIILSLSQEVRESMSFLDVNINEVRSDLLLLENQIPLYFIMKVFCWLFPQKDPKASFETLLEPFIFMDMPWRINHGGNSRGAAHLLDLYWRCSTSPEVIDRVNEFRSHGSEQEQPSWAEIYIAFNAPKEMANATELHQKAGIIFQNLNREGIDHNLDVWSNGLLMGIVMSFVQLLFSSRLFRFMWRSVLRLYRSRASSPHESKRESNGQDKTPNQTQPDVHQKTPSPRDVIFSNGIMRMPCLKIDSSQTTLLLNLIALESSMLPTERTISIYMKFMDTLIDSEKDVELLQQSGVIYNTLSSHKMAATFFNDIGNFCLIGNYALLPSDLYENVKKYYGSKLIRRMVRLEQDYLSSPWAGISVCAGVLLLFLSGVQTYYTVFPKK